MQCQEIKANWQINFVFMQRLKCFAIRIIFCPFVEVNVRDTVSNMNRISDSQIENDQAIPNRTCTAASQPQSI